MSKAASTSRLKTRADMAGEVDGRVQNKTSPTVETAAAPIATDCHQSVSRKMPKAAATKPPSDTSQINTPNPFANPPSPSSQDWVACPQVVLLTSGIKNKIWPMPCAPTTTANTMRNQFDIIFSFLTAEGAEDAEIIFSFNLRTLRVLRGF